MSLIKRGGTKGIGNPERDEDGTKNVGVQAVPDEDGTRQVKSTPRDEDGTRNVDASKQKESTAQPEKPDRVPATQNRGPGPGTGRTSATRGVKGMLNEDGTRGHLSTSLSRTGTGRGTKQSLSDVNVLQPNTVLQNRYVIEEVLGIGGMSVVYQGRDLRFKDVVRSCAIKEMYQRSPDSQTRMLSLKFFEREAGMLATLNHPAIPKVYDFFEETDRVYLVLELVQGKDLEELLEEKGEPFDEVTVGNWALQICDVLAYLHSNKPEPIVFRDMKPSNIMLSSDDRIVLVDFGIARLLDRSNRKGTMIGTEGYASPEQFRGIAEAASDIYSLGATLHQLLSGTDPRGETPFTFHERPLRMFNRTVSPEMEAIVARALEYDMNARWESANDLRQALLSVPNIARSVPAAQEGLAGINLPHIATSVTTTELIWSFTCEDEVRSSPLISNGMLFVGCYDTNVYALDAGRGEFRWKYATEGGVNSSPDVWQELVIVGSEDGIIYGLDMRRGQARWKFRTDQPIRSSPRVDERVVFVGSDDQHFYAIDGLRGTMMWKYRTWMPLRSSACIAEGKIFTGGNDGNVYCLDIRNGGLRWKQRTKGAVYSTPAYSDGMVFVGSNDNSLYALDSQGGWPSWRFRTGHSILSSPCVVGKRVFVGSADNCMYAVETKNGRLSWKFETGGQITSSPRAEAGRIYFGSTDGFIYCLDAGTGSVVWQYQTEGPVVSSPYITNGTVYIGSMDHKVYALKV